ncbi:hypothetical protein ACFL1T_03840 [Chlamydiota bacterium]
MKFIIVILIILVIATLTHILFFISPPFSEPAVMDTLSLRAIQKIFPVKTIDGKLYDAYIDQGLFDDKTVLKNIDEVTSTAYKNDINDLSLKNDIDSLKRQSSEIIRIKIDKLFFESLRIDELQDIFLLEEKKEKLFQKTKELRLFRFFKKKEQYAASDLFLFKKVQYLFKNLSSKLSSLIALCEETIFLEDSNERFTVWKSISEEQHQLCWILKKRMLLFSENASNAELSLMLKKFYTAFDYLLKNDFGRFELYYKDGRRIYLRYYLSLVKYMRGKFDSSKMI